MWKRSSHPKDTTVHNHLDARSYKGYIVTGSSPVLTTKKPSAKRLVWNEDRDYRYRLK